MLQTVLRIIADNDKDDGYAPFIFMAVVVVISLIGAISKAVQKSREQRGQPPGAKPAGDRPPSVDEFLEQIRRMAKGETGPVHPPEQPTSLQEPVSRPAPPPPPRPVTPVRAAQRPGPPPPPPPRPLRPQTAAEQPRRPPPPPPRPVPAPRPVERPAFAPRAAEQPHPTAEAKVTLESVSALTESVSRLAAAAPKVPPKRRRERAGKKPPEKPAAAKPPKKAALVMPGLAASPAELRAALRQRLAAGPSALREAVLLGEVLGQPIGMRRRRVHRPGGPSRLI